jgi:SpoVK/Ycf46/Vps4 family AAA+-type ATPase
LETTLRDILEVASVWDSVILIDEADIFLEKRSDNDIKRNALVGVFLRLLEYHQGILFLTTNRVKSFDEAFHSRISVALNYPSLDLESRIAVWKNLLEAAGEVENPLLDINVLAASSLNGRQIRTMIRLAQSLASSEGEPLANVHFSRCISVATKFHDEVGMPDLI